MTRPDDTLGRVFNEVERAMTDTPRPTAESPATEAGRYVWEEIEASIENGGGLHVNLDDILRIEHEAHQLSVDGSHAIGFREGYRLAERKAEAAALSDSARPLSLDALTPDSLDAAWKAATDALPEGCFGPAVEPRWPNRWRAWARLPAGTDTIDAFAGSEAAALQALATALTKP
jgi:hypothetical protein